MNGKERISIRHIKQEYGVGNDLARRLYPALNDDPQIYKGRPPCMIFQSELDFVNNYKLNFNVGYQRMYQVSQKKINAPKTLTEWKTRKIYDYDNLYTRGAEYHAPQIHDQRYVAKYAGQAWHTDLHFTEKYLDEDFKQYYLIAYIDDRSRKIVHYELLEQKTMELTAESLINALDKCNKPKTIIIDNGKEFVGKTFKNALKTRKIQCHCVTPYTPEENGKIERFWQTLENTKPKEKRLRGEYLDSLIQEYNTVWHHHGLKEITNRDMTPEEAWQTMPNYEGQADACYIYY